MQRPAKPQARRSAVRRASFSRKFTARHAPARTSNESVIALAHDARNVVAALELCCDLLAEPGVLAEENQHFAAELQAVASASSALVEQLAALRVVGVRGWASTRICSTSKPRPRSGHIDDLAAAVEQLRGPLTALAGARIELHMECLSCFGRVPLSQEALTRILINLTRNAAEAMPNGGRIRITVQQGDGGSFFDAEQPPRTVLLCVQDSGPGIPQDRIGRIFDAGFTTKGESAPLPHGAHRGLGLNIVRRLAEAAGGSVRATSAPGGGARFELELPLIHSRSSIGSFPADFPERTTLEC
jgi:signal transduction histidine kinase